MYASLQEHLPATKLSADGIAEVSRRFAGTDFCFSFSANRAEELHVSVLEPLVHDAVDDGIAAAVQAAEDDADHVRDSGDELLRENRYEHHDAERKPGDNERHHDDEERPG